MKCLKKIVALAAVLMVGVIAAFAIDEDSVMMNEIVENMSRKEFNEMFDESGDEEMKETLEEIFSEMSGDEDLGTCSLTKFYLVTSDNIDDETEEVGEYLHENLPSGIKKNDAVLSWVIRDFNSRTGIMDGWLVCTHYVDDDNIESFIYYFAEKFQY